MMFQRYKTVTSSYIKTFFKDKTLVALLFAVLLIGVIFGEYTFVYYRKLTSDYSLLSEDFCFVIKGDFALSDYKKLSLDDGIAARHELYCFYENEQTGETEFYTKKEFSYARFYNWKSSGLFPADNYEIGDSYGDSERNITVVKTAEECGGIQFDVALLDDAQPISGIVYRFYKKLSLKSYNEISAQASPALAVAGLEDYEIIDFVNKDKVSIFDESFISLCFSFLVAVAILVMYTVKCIQARSKRYYEVLFLLGYSEKTVSFFEFSILSSAYCIAAAAGSAVFYFLFYIAKMSPYVGHFVFSDALIVVLCGPAVVAMAELILQQSRRQRYE